MPALKVMVRIEVPVVFEGLTEDFEKNTEDFRDAAVDTVMSFLPSVVLRHAEVDTVRNVGGIRYYWEGALAPAGVTRSARHVVDTGRSEP